MVRGVCESCGGVTYKGSSLCCRCVPGNYLRPLTPEERAKSAARWAAVLPPPPSAQPGYVRPSRRGVCIRCGRPMSLGKGSAPPERRACHECRGMVPVPYGSRWGSPPAKPLLPRDCELCGNSFVPKYRPPGKPPQRFCSLSCTSKSRNPLAAALRRTRHLALSRARNLRHAQTWDGIADEEILERDGWLCQIPGCKRRPIRQDLKFPHPRSKSIDHIIPLSHGGDDTAVNKRAAHLTCNVARGNQMEEVVQLPLFGVIREPPLVTRTHNGATTRPPRAPRSCGICGEPLVAGKCKLHLPVYFAACDHCGTWFASRSRGRKFCHDEICGRQRAAEVHARMSEDAKERKRKRDRERRWVDPAYRARAIAATARWHERQRVAQ